MIRVYFALPRLFNVCHPSPDRHGGVDGGAVQGRWRGDGRELYYLALDGALMGVDFAGGSPPRIGTGKRLFDSGLRPTYNLDHFEASRDGKRFLIREPVGAAAQRFLNVVLNWTTGLSK